jgi:hypothetical protein
MDTHRSNGRRPGLLVVLALSLLAGPTPGQDGAIEVPHELSSFWTKWVEAKKSPNDDPMDRVVRQNLDDAEFLLNLLIGDVSRRDEAGLFHELRLIAWSMDRVEKTERYITRVRFVRDLSIGDRKRRVGALGLWSDALASEQAAEQARTGKAWDDSVAAYENAARSFEVLADWEYMVFCLVRCGEIQRKRSFKWDEAQYLKRIIDVAGKLVFVEPALKISTDNLRILIASGVDPDGARPADAPSGSDARGGIGLEAFEQGSKQQAFSFERASHKKGITGVELPGFYCTEQYQLWPVTWVEEQGPSDFDYGRLHFKPGGNLWSLSRDGMETFLLDCDGDGEPEARFSASSTPSFIEIDDPAGGNPYGFRVATLSDREPLFDIDTNYAPDEKGARLRFFTAYWYEAKVLGENWKIFDLDMDGSLGTPYVWGSDPYTDLDQLKDSFWTTDAVQIGRSKRAIPWSTVLPVGGEFYRTWVDFPKGQIKLRKMNIATGEVLLDVDTKTKPQVVVVRAVGEQLQDAYFDIVPARKGRPVTLPVGTYQLAYGRISKGKKTNMDQARIYIGDSSPFEVKEGETTTIEMGAPYKLTFRTRDHVEGTELDARSLRIFGRGGEEYAMLYNEPLRPTLEVRDGADRKVGKPRELRQAGMSEWEIDELNNVLWFPLDEVVQVPRGESYSLRLTQKAHGLLGGPFESDWIQ